MANWFKIYETDLDETRMRYAMSQLAEVWPVWTGILMECCKHRGDTIKWGKEEHELFGFSERLKISIPLVNKAISLLCDIHYIERLEGFLKVLKWNEKQDDYLARKAQGYWEKRGEKKKLTVIHGESHIEENREDKNRGGDNPAPLPLAQVFDAWNALGVVPKCLLISDKRRRLLESRFRDPFFTQNWAKAMESIKQSKFCQGDNDRGWKAGFDWFLQPDSCAKLLEGKYNSAPTATVNGVRQRPSIPEQDADKLLRQVQRDLQNI